MKNKGKVKQVKRIIIGETEHNTKGVRSIKKN